MHLITFSKISINKFHGILAELEKEFDQDCFLSTETHSCENISYAGINISKELIVIASTTKNEIKQFCFLDNKITFGYLSYNYGLLLKNIPQTTTSNFPYGHLKQYSTLLKHDSSTQTLSLHINTPESERVIEIIKAKNQPDTFEQKLEVTQMSQNIDSSSYIAKVTEVLNHIKSGDTYQLNLSIKFEALFHKIPDIFKFFLDLATKHPAPFYTYFKSKGSSLISSSPERFIKVTDSKLLSQPIKGTRYIDSNKEACEYKLKTSSKESAELSMIVDLIRNDLSEFSIPGSVKVNNHKSIFQVDSLLQMYSNVSGILKKELDVIDLLLGSFPGGSITGCPKKRSMELIEELEPHSRDIYCGSFFVIHDKKNMDSSIAIRTGYFNNNIFKFYAGSGIVIQSKPDEEYRETLNKVEKILNLMRVK